MQLLKEVIGTQYFAVLNSVGEGQPYSNLVSFAVNDNLKSLVFVTDRNTRKYRNIEENNNISLLIDNRTNQPSDISKAIAITVIGKASEEVDRKTTFSLFFLPDIRSFSSFPMTTIMLSYW